MTTAFTPHVGALLARYRRAAGLTQEALAAAAGVSVRGIQNLERGVSKMPRPATIALLAAALGLSPQEREALLAASHRPAPIGDPVPPPRAAPAGAIPLIGRGAELALLDAFLAPADSGLRAAPLLLLAGEPGIGKTRLLQALAARAPALGWTVLMGGCHRGSEEPYAPVTDALAGYLRARSPARLADTLGGCAWLARLLPELAPVLEPLSAGALAPGHERRLIFAAVARLLANVAGPAGTLLVLDDLQGAGPDGLALLAALVQDPALPLRVVGGYRDTEVRPADPLGLLLGDLASAGLARQHPLGPLSDGEAATLLGDLLAGASAADPAVAARSLRRAGGVPFFLVSFAQALAAGGGEAVPWDAAQGVRRRVATLPDAARAVLGAAAIAGRHATRAALLAVAGRPADESLVGLEEACRAGLLVEEGERGYAVAHDVIREVLEADLGAARRATLHRQVAAALEAAPAPVPAEILAFHYTRGEVPDKAATYLELAGERAWAQGAHAAAERCYRELVALLDALRRADRALHARELLADVLYGTGRYEAAVPLLDAVAAGLAAAGDWAGLARVTARLGWAHSRRGTPDAGIAGIAAVLALLERRGMPPPAALHAALGQLLFGAGRYRESLAAIERAAERARASGDDHGRALADAQRINILQTVGRVADALRVADAVFPAIEAVDDLDARRRAHGDLAYIHILRADLATGRHHVDRALALAERTGDPAARAFALALRAWLATIGGDWPGAAADLERAQALEGAAPDSWYAPYPRLFLARLQLRAGDWDAAASAGHAALALAERGGDLQAVRWTAQGLAELAVRQGSPTEAVTRLAPLLDRAGLEECDVTGLLPVLAWARLDLGEADEASALVEQALARARREGLRLVVAEALLAGARVALRRGDEDAAGRGVEAGLALARAMPHPYVEALLLHLDGERRALRGEGERARGRLQRARAILRRLGARRDAAETERVLAALDAARDGGN